VEFSRIHEIRAMRLLVEMLRQRVGSPLSIASLARDLQVSPNTIAKYIEILEALYIIFLVRPYHRNVSRSILKAPKVYFFDTAYVSANDGAKWENAYAAMLLKHVHYEQDILGKHSSLHYLRTKEGAEVDFMISDHGGPVRLINVSMPIIGLHRHCSNLPACFLMLRLSSWCVIFVRRSIDGRSGLSGEPIGWLNWRHKTSGEN